MIEHEGGDLSVPPLRPGEHEGDVSLAVPHVGHQEGAAHHQLLVRHHAAELRVLQGFRHCWTMFSFSMDKNMWKKLGESVGQ